MISNSSVYLTRLVSNTDSSDGVSLRQDYLFFGPMAHVHLRNMFAIVIIFCNCFDIAGAETTLSVCTVSVSCY